MRMTVNNFIEAIASKLAELWPDRKVFVDKIPKDADGNFFVGIIETGQDKKLDRRRTRSYQFEVLYFLKTNDNMVFNAWAESMFDNFEALDVVESGEQTRRVILSGHEARKDEAGVFQFVFDADFHIVIAPETYDPMESLEQKEELK